MAVVARNSVNSLRRDTKYLRCSAGKRSLVMAAKGRGMARGGVGGASGRRMTQQRERMVQSMPALPEDDGNPQFFIFVRSEVLRKWQPLTILAGGSAAKLMTGVMEGEMGKKLYSKTLTNNLAQSIYKDEDKIKDMIKKNMQTFKNTQSFQYGYKMIDRSKNMFENMQPDGLTMIPPEEETRGAIRDAAESVQAAMANTGVGETLSNLTESDAVKKASGVVEDFSKTVGGFFNK